MELVQSANLEAKASGRVEQIDIMRGFALLGIGLENIFSMHTTNALFADYSARFPAGINHFLLLGLMVLVRGKFYPIFSFVFGASAALGIPTQGTKYFLRRLAGLFFLGALQIIFIWEGDVLMQYVLMGLVLLLLKDWNTKPLVALGAVLLMFSFVGKGWGVPEEQNALQGFSLYKTGTFPEMMAFRVQEYLQSVFTWPALYFYSRIFAFMLLGYAFARSGSLKLLTIPARLRKVFLVHLAVVITIAFLAQIAGWRSPASETLWLKEVALSIYFYTAVMCLAFLPVVLRQLQGLPSLLSPLQWLGKLTLTHYLTQNLIFSLLFFPYGFGLFQKLEPWQVVLVYVFVLGIQVVISNWVLRLYRQGPVEAFLRWVAGKKQKGAS